MSTRRMLGIYNNLYNQINKYYNEDFLSIQKACNKVDISTSKYYDLCRKLGKPSVAIEGNITEPTIKRGTKETTKIKKETIPKVKKDVPIKKGTKELKIKKDVVIKKGTKESKHKVQPSLKTKSLPKKTIPEKKKSTAKLIKSMKGGKATLGSNKEVSPVISVTNVISDNNLDDRNDDRFDDRMIEKDKPTLIPDNDIINIFIKTDNDSHDSEASMTGLTEMIDMQ